MDDSTRDDRDLPDKPFPPDKEVFDEDVKPIQFQLRSMLLFSAAFAGILSVMKMFGAGLGFTIFAICLLLMMTLLAGMLVSSRNRLIVIRRIPTEAEAFLIQNYLRDHGIAALANASYLSGFSTRHQGYADVLVPQSQVDRAKQLLDDVNDEDM